MTYEMTGTVKKVYDTQTFASGFSKREFVITTEDDRYPQDVALACLKNDCAKLDNLQVGERLRVCFRIRGREYNGRHFVNLEAFRLEHLDGGATEADSVAADGSEPPLDDEPLPF